MSGTFAGYLGIFVLGVMFGITVCMLFVLHEQEERVRRFPRK